MKESLAKIVFDSTFPQVKLRNDMPDDMLRDAIETAGRVISGVEDFEVQGKYIRTSSVAMLCLIITWVSFYRVGVRGGNQDGIRCEVVSSLALRYRQELWFLCDARDEEFYLLLPR
jgi:hypothetical protein